MGDDEIRDDDLELGGEEEELAGAKRKKDLIDGDVVDSLDDAVDEEEDEAEIEEPFDDTYDK